MLRRISSIALGVWLAGSFAGAELSKTFKSWPDTAAGFLLTKDERKAYEKLTNDQEAKAFIELFWAKRDPNLDTAANEFKEDFDLRVAASDKMFSYLQSPGSLSDRGKVLALMGKPSNLQQLPPATDVDPEDVGASGNREAWVYDKATLPPDAKTDQVIFLFVESAPGQQDFHLDRRNRQNVVATKLLAAAPERLLLHPKLTEVPKLGFLPGSKIPTAAQLAVLGTTPRPWPDKAAVVTASGVTSVTTLPLWVHVFLPDTTAPATQAVGRVVKGEGGEEVGTFVLAVQAISVEGGRAYQLSFPVASGAWKVDLALLDATGPVAVTTIDAVTEAVPAEGPYLAQYLWGVDVRQNTEARLGDPFNIGGWHVLPRIDGRYTPKETISYFCFAIRPSLDEQGQAKVEVSMALFHEDKKITEVPAQTTGLSQIGGDLWMFGSSLPLRGFRKTGDYRLELTLKDVASGVARTTKVPLHVEVEAPAAAPAPAPPTGGATPR